MGKKFKSLKRCSVSNKVINGREVVIVDYAIDYVEKMGYQVISKRKMMENNNIRSYQNPKREILNKSVAMSIFFILISIAYVIPLISSALPTSVLTTDEQKLLLTINNTLINVNNYCSDTKTIISKGTVNIHGTEYLAGDYGTVFLQLKDSLGSPVNNGSCYLNINYPASYNISHPLWINNSPMLYNQNSNGLYYYDTYLPNYTGVYMVTGNCVYIDNPIWYFNGNSILQSTLSQEIGTNTGNTLSLNSFSDGVYTKCVTSGGGGTKYCIGNYTFDVSNKPIKLDLYWSGSTTQAGTLIHFSIWNYTSGSWYYLPNFVTSAGTSTVTTISSLDEYSTNSIPYNDTNFRLGNKIIIRINSSGISHTRFNNWLSLKASENNTFIQDVKGSSELHISEGLNSLNSSIMNIPNAIWSYTGTISNTIGDFLSNKIWNFNNRNLTYYPTNNITASEIWSYPTRDLTYYPVVNLSLSNISASEITDKILCYLEEINTRNSLEWNIKISTC